MTTTLRLLPIQVPLGRDLSYSVLADATLDGLTPAEELVRVLTEPTHTLRPLVFNKIHDEWTSPRLVDAPKSARMREECPMSSSSKRQIRKKRRKFTPDFKADVVRLCESGAESIAEVCRRLELTETSVRNWVRQADVDQAGGTPDALSTSEREELMQLRRDNKRLKMEREILKKATAFFAKENS